MLVGKKVNVYQKPNTKEDFEGVARITGVIRFDKADEQDRTAMCWVSFFNDDCPNDYWRTINLEDIIYDD